jgi:peptidoglycan hydrolase-like protein with peptidoglycan-binding domain
VKRPVDGFERRSVSVQPLQRGMTGSAVTQLQQKLVAAKFMSVGDFKSGPGVYGPRTEAAVKRLQAHAGLPVTGVASASTQQALASGARFEPVRVAKLSETFTDEVTQPMGSRVA